MAEDDGAVVLSPGIFGKVTVVSDSEQPVGEFMEVSYDPHAEARTELAAKAFDHFPVLRHTTGVVCRCNKVLAGEREWAAHYAKEVLP